MKRERAELVKSECDMFRNYENYDVSITLSLDIIIITYEVDQGFRNIAVRPEFTLLETRMVKADMAACTSV